MRIRKLTIALPVLAISFACNKEDKKVQGYEPIYENTTAIQAVTYQQQGQPVQNGGKIYILGDTVYQVETDKGIHLIDVSDKQNPKNAGFITLRGCREVAVRGNTILTNNFTELLALRLNGNGVSVIRRVPEALAEQTTFSVPPERGYFICPVQQPGKIITGWQKAILINPKCYY
jgi:hypothetical protein